MGTKIRLPGYGIALNEGTDKSVPLEKAFPNALLGDGYCGPLLTVREYTMMELMNRLTDKTGWETKVYDKAIVAKWKAEALGTPDIDISEKMVDWCIAELEYKACLFRDSSLVETLDGIYKSDVIVSEQLRKSLLEAVAPLENVPGKHKDWHPGSNEQVLDLVHPSLFPLVYGQSRILPNSTVTVQDCIDRCGNGEVIPVPSGPEIIDMERARYRYRSTMNDDGAGSWSQKFQWLPTDFELPQDSNDVKITSYINNLHPYRHSKLYNVIAQIVSKAVTLWNATLSPLQTDIKPPPRVELEGHGFKTDIPFPDLPRASEGDYDGSARFSEELEDWEQDYDIDQPEPQEFETPDQRIRQRYPSQEIKGELDLRKEYGQLQIIVKLANIHLTPEKPKYDGGSWHIEGQMNENICATALYYYDTENISDSLLAFRSQVEDGTDIPYEAGCLRALETIYGFENDDPAIHEIGKVVTKSGRLLTFPNVYQHCVQPFHLLDPTKPGHRKILALFLCDPHKRIISTANIPCQQKEWWEELVRDIGPLGSVPKEINDHILGMVTDFPISLERAKEQRLELMEERKKLQVSRMSIVLFWGLQPW